MARIPVENDPTMEKMQSDDVDLSAEQASDSNCYRPVAATKRSTLPNKADPSIDSSIDPVILRTLSSSPLMSRNPSDTSVGCLQVDSIDASYPGPDANAIPRRNLTEAFEEIYTEPSVDAHNTPMIKQSYSKDSESKVISPTGVAELDSEHAEVSYDAIATKTTEATPDPVYSESILPRFDLHPDLKRELSDALVDRVSFYAVIHAINTEATAMAANDERGYNRNPEDQREEYDQLVVAVNGYPQEPLAPSSSMINAALIDEERWLLDTIDSRNSDEARSVKACPPTFLQAMGERDYENPLTSLSNGSRTQLWKPSRSWWEAKSGKNPWIEPKSHNKRWRYLWPLIHYHKFLAKCIKKLKRNGVDVKTSVSPVAVFLREEVCAVSDHLAAVSLFDSDDWMNCLEHFTGWTSSDPDAEEHVRLLVSKLKLCPLSEPGDVDSPLLRSQIDEQYLRAMAAARAQMSDSTPEQQNRRPHKDPSLNSGKQHTPNAKQKSAGAAHAMGPPPAYPRSNVPGSFQPPSHYPAASPGAIRRPHWGYQVHPTQWWSGGWHPHPAYHYNDDASVQSGLSADHYDMGMYAQQYHYYPPLNYPQHQPHASQQVATEPVVGDMIAYGHDGFNTEQFTGMSWSGPPHLGHLPQVSATPTQPVTPSPAQSTQGTNVPSEKANSQHGVQATPNEETGGDQTPYKYNPASPYWGHLDHTTLAMMGIATPQAVSTPQTPARRAHSSPVVTTDNTDDLSGATVNAQPLLLRQQYPSYGYYGSREGYGPPSPATQFMMSPQANFGYGYNGYDNFSQGWVSTPQKTPPNLSRSKGVTNTTAKSPVMTPPPRQKRESPSTVETTVETASL